MLRTLADAQAEVDSAAQWYEDRNPGLGEPFHDAFGEALERIDALPGSGLLCAFATIQREVRRVKVGHFPFVVFYFTRGDEVVVVAVSHGAREPGYWLDRIREVE